MKFKQDAAFLFCHRADLVGILYAACKKLKIPVHFDKKLENIKVGDARTSLDSIGIDKNGLEIMDRKILKNLIVNFNGGPTGGKSLAISINEDIQTIEDVYEPYLIKEGFIERTSRGRIATDKAYQLFEMKKNN